MAVVDEPGTAPADLTTRLLAADDDLAAAAGPADDLGADLALAGEERPLGEVLRAGGFATIGVLFGLNLVDELDRIALQVLGPDIQRTFDLSDGALAALNGVGAVMILAGAIPFGLLADRRKRTTLITISSFVWSIFALAGGLAASAWQLALTRVGNGLGKGNGPVHRSLLADRYPIEGRGRVFALHDLANPAGAIVGPALAGGIAALAGGDEGWRWALVLMAVPCLVLSAASLLLREPPRGVHEAAAALDLDEDAALALVGTSDEPPVSLSAGFDRLRKIRTFSNVMTALGVLGFVVFGAPTVFNLFLERHYDLDALGRGVVSSVIAVGGAVGAVVGGRAADRLFRADPARIFRQVAVALAVFGVLYPAGLFAPNVALLCAVHAVAFAFVLGPLVSMSTVVAAVVPARLRGLGFAAVGLYLFLVGGLLGGVIIGVVSDSIGERSALVLFAPPSCIGAAIVIAAAAKHVRRDIALVVEELREEQHERARLAEVGLEATPIIQVRNLDFSYDRLQVLFDVDLDVRRGEVLALLGTNGAGKSTLLRVISGLALPERGAVRLDGRTITFSSPKERVALGIVQVPGGKAVFPSLTVRENLLAGADSFIWDTDLVATRLEAVLDRFPRLRERLDQPAGTMSGGEQQMLAIGKALLLDPKVLIIDELSLGLAPNVVQELLTVVEGLRADGVTLVLVEQSVNVALTVADRAVFMEKGQVRFEGPARDLLERDDLVRAVFLGAEGG